MLATAVESGAVTMKFADKLRQLRQTAAMSQPEFATAAGISVSAVRNYEQGDRIPSWRALVKIARVLNVSLDVFSACDEVAEDPKAKKAKGRTSKSE